MTSIRLYLVPFWVLLLAACQPLPAQDDAGAGGQQAMEPRITLGHDTSRIDKPLTEDGYVDYLAAIRAADKQGVRPERNIAVVVWRLAGPKDVFDDVQFRKRFFAELEIEPLPDNGNYLVTTDEFLQQKFGNRISGQISEQFHDRLWSMTQRPWTKADHPLLYDYVQLNSKLLDTAVRDILVRDQYYAPRLSPDGSGMLIAILLPTAQKVREIGRLLVGRAMLRVAEGDFAAAEQDLLACHRLGRMSNQTLTLVEMLVNIAVERMACEATATMARQAGYPAERALPYLEKLSKLPPPATFSECLDTGERYTFLSSVTEMARTGDFAVLDDGDDGIAATFRRRLAANAIDWNEPLRKGNYWYDRLVAASKIPGYPEQSQAHGEIMIEIEELSEEINQPKSLAKLLFRLGSPRKAISQKLGDIFIALLLPAVHAAHVAEVEHTARFRLTRIALALSAYRDREGQYPNELKALENGYLAQVPQDPFTGHGFRYRKRGNEYLLYSVGSNLEDENGQPRGDGGTDDVILGADS